MNDIDKLVFDAIRDHASADIHPLIDHIEKRLRLAEQHVDLSASERIIRAELEANRLHSVRADRLEALGGDAA